MTFQEKRQYADDLAANATDNWAGLTLVQHLEDGNIFAHEITWVDHDGLLNFQFGDSKDAEFYRCTLADMEHLVHHHATLPDDDTLPRNRQVFAELTFIPLSAFKKEATMDYFQRWQYEMDKETKRRKRQQKDDYEEGY